MTSSAAVREMILLQLNRRSMSSSICPSDVARALYATESQWRALMPTVREMARQMACEGLLQITQGHQPVDPNSDIRGPIRITKNPSGVTSNE